VWMRRGILNEKKRKEKKTPQQFYSVIDEVPIGISMNIKELPSHATVIDKHNRWKYVHNFLTI
jgi:hypothetical protein